MPEVIDQLNRQVQVPEKIESIVSLVPSQTELLFYLGLQDSIKGVTKFCIHPDLAKTNCKIIGGTKSIHFEKIDELKPDIIFGNKEENTKEIIETLSEKYPVWVSDIATRDSAYAMIESIGQMLGKKQKSIDLVRAIKKTWDPLANKYGRKKVLYLIWRRPYMAVGSNNYIDHVLSYIGLKNVVHTPRYPELIEDDIRRLQPDVVLLSSEPYPFKEKHLNEIQAMAPNALVQLVDGEMFSWYGPRMLAAAEYLDQLTFDFKA